jgi:DNA polymerase-3 subunit alpha
MSQIKTSLQNYTTYSVFSGVGSVTEWVKQAAEYGYTSLAITDKTTMAGAVRFQTDCIKNKIKPIFGEDFNLVLDVDARNEQDEKRADAVAEVTALGSIILYAKTTESLTSLYQCNNASQRAFYFRPRIDTKLLKQYAKDLVCVIPISGVGPLLKLVNDGGELVPKYMTTLLELSDIFGDDLYFSINPMSSTPELDKLNEFYINFTDNLIVSYNCHYVKRNGHKLYETVYGMEGKVRRHLPRHVDRAFLPRSSSDFKHSMDKDFIEGLVENTNKLADSLNAKISTGNAYMPKAIPRGKSVKADLEEMIISNFNLLIYDLPTDVKTIDDLESVMNNYTNVYPKIHMSKGESEKENKPVSEYIRLAVDQFRFYETQGFHDYFHVGADIAGFARTRGYEASKGRGSVGSSTPAFLLGITETDAAKYNLPHSRFLNPSRAGLPDIDFDFAPSLRDEILNEFLPSKYGVDKVVPIGAFQRLKAKACIKQVAATTAYGILDNEGNVESYSKDILDEKLDTFIKATTRGEEEIEELVDNRQFQEFYNKHSDWFDNSIVPLLDSVSANSIHASGIIITPDPFFDSLPVWWNAGRQCFVTQWDKDDLDKVGFVKLDILSLEALQMITKCKQLIAKRGDIPPDMANIPLDDEEALFIFYSGATGGIFQYNSALNKRFCKKAGPMDFREVYNITAVNRPGVLEVGGDEDYLRGDMQHPLPEVRKVLDATNGVLIYQEQMMEISRIVGDFSEAEADFLRKACGKKKVEEMVEWERIFKDRSYAKGYDVAVIDQLWDQFIASASYLFNKSHTVSYALLAYMQAYLKSRWPLEFWAAALDSAPSDKKKKDTSIYAVKYEAEDEGVKFVFPTYLAFSDQFEPSTDGKIYWPLTKIQGVGEAAAALLTDNGKRKGFTSLDEFIDILKASRAPKKKDVEKPKFVNINIVKKLINAGFFSPAGKPWEVAEIIFDAIGEELPYTFTSKKPYYWQTIRNSAYGFQVERWKDMPGFSNKVRSYTYQQLDGVKDDSYIVIGGRVAEVNINYTRAKGEKYATLIVEDRQERYYIRMWGNVWNDEGLSQSGRRPRQDDLIELVVKKTTYNDKASLTFPSINSHLKIIERME